MRRWSLDDGERTGAHEDESWTNQTGIEKPTAILAPVASRIPPTELMPRSPKTAKLQVHPPTNCHYNSRHGHGVQSLNPLLNATRPFMSLS